MPHISYAQDWLDNEPRQHPRHRIEEDFDSENQSEQGRGGRKRKNRSENFDGKNNADQKGQRKQKGQQNNVIATLIKEDSQIADKLRQLKEKDARSLQRFQRDMRTQMKQFKILLQNKDKESKEYQETTALLKTLINKELDSMILANTYNENPSDEQKAKIKQKLEESFTIKAQLHQKHIEQVKERTSQLEEMLAKRKSHKEEIIEMRLSQLAKSKDSLYSW